MRRQDWQPAHIQLERRGELARRAQTLRSLLPRCRLCPRQCSANHSKGEQGICQSSSRVKVAAAHAHFGEEPPLVGRHGSGTIFFSRCNLLSYCQNWEISHRGDGVFISDEELGGLMLRLQQSECHNINLITPTHCVANIVYGLRSAIAGGLHIPLVYNCGGYEPLDVLRVLERILTSICRISSTRTGRWPRSTLRAPRTMDHVRGFAKLHQKNCPAGWPSSRTGPPPRAISSACRPCSRCNQTPGRRKRAYPRSRN